MRTSGARGPAFPAAGRRRALLVAAVVPGLVLAFAGTAVGAGPAPPPGPVVVLNSYHPGYSWSDHEMDGLLEVLRGGVPPRSVEIEYLDAKNVPGLSHFPAEVALLRAKYEGRTPALVVVADDPALEFARRHVAELWPGVAVVFCGINGYTPEKTAGLARVTGVAEALDVAGTLESALRLCPSTRTVVVLHDATVTGLGARRDFDAVAPRFARRVAFEVLPDMAIEPFLARLESLPSDRIVLALSYSRDAAGRVFDHTQIAELLAQHSSVPVFVVHEERLGRGVVGGVLLSGREQGRQAGLLARRVLSGEDPSRIPVVRDTARPEFDYEGLVRWHVDPRALPPGAEVINVPETFYRKYRGLVLGTVSVLLALVGIVVTLGANVVRRRNAEKAVESERAFLQSVLDGLPDPVFVLGVDHALERQNESARVLTESWGGGAASGPFALFHPPGSAPEPGSEPCPVDRVLAANGPVAFDRRHAGADGAAQTYAISAAPLRRSDGTVSAVVTSLHDITELKRANFELVEQGRRLDHLAHHDGLTGVANRLLFHDRFQQAILHARRGRHGVALLFLDLDRFKSVNDAHGHEVGDEVLTAVAGRIRTCVRESDTVARLGGDEFGVLLDGPVDATAAASVAAKILSVLREPHGIGRQEVFVGASLGISLFPADGTSASELLRHADAAMYLAKEKGRGTFQFYTEALNERILRQIALEKRLRRALAKGALRVVYQPIVSLPAGGIVAAEALARWTDEELGEVSPAEFIPVAEEAGLIGALGEEVLRQACAAAQVWRRAGFGQMSVAVNVSPRQIWQREIVGSVERVLAETGLPPSALELELTESVLLPRTEDVPGLLGELRLLGVRLSVDDFGTGYSSLGYLKRLPLDTLKVAQEFVRDLSVDPNDAAIVRAVVALAHTLGFRVVAEGVESAEHLAFFRAHGCDLAQGYLFSRAVPADELGRLLGAGPLVPASLPA